MPQDSLHEAKLAPGDSVVVHNCVKVLLLLDQSLRANALKVKTDVHHDVEKLLRQVFRRCGQLGVTVEVSIGDKGNLLALPLGADCLESFVDLERKR